jgi:hypothetical protein
MKRLYRRTIKLFTDRRVWVRQIVVFIQAYTLGKVIDDVSANPVDAESYADLINTIIENVFIEEH